MTLLVLGVVVLGAVSFERLGAREPSGPAPGTARSSIWLCPHGGGPGYEGFVFLANPGEHDVVARVTELRPRGSGSSSQVTVPAGTQVALAVDASRRSSSTFVEAFGGWVAAGWQIRGAEGELGIGTEPCSADAGTALVTAAATTGEGDQAYLVAMNPFASDAVFDVALFTAERAPVRDSALTDFTLRPGESRAIRLNAFAQGEQGLGVAIDVSSGKLAASTLVVSDGRGIGSVLASSAPSDRRLMLTSSGSGRSVLAVTVPTVTDEAGLEQPSDAALGSTFGATLRSAGAPQPAGGIAEQTQAPESAAQYAVTTTGPSAVDVVVQDGAPIAAALRTAGAGKDGAATAGSAAPATSWVVTPTIAGAPARPGLLVLNAGRSQATVDIRSIPRQGDTPADTTITVDPGSVAGVPREFLDAIGDAALMVTSAGEPVVVLGASTSLGNEGRALFGLAAGVPIPERETTG
ncbi:MAG TPA: DUF5719 family protein [Actinomycetota bacterium]